MSGKKMAQKNIKIDLISKEMFCEIINEIKDYDRRIDTIERVLMENCDDAVYAPPTLKDALLKLLQEIFNDKDTDWIGYYIYELEYGAEWKPGTITEDDRDIKLAEPEDLYDLLVSNLNRKENK